MIQVSSKSERKNALTAIWTTPKTWNIGELVTADALNEQVRDNLDYLASRPVIGTYQSSGAAYTTTSTSDVLVNASLSLSVPVKLGRVLVFCSFKTTVSNPSFLTTYITLYIDGNASNLLAQHGNTTYTALVFPITGLSVATHTFDLRWRVSTSAYSASMWRGADYPLSFWVMEI
jgi:hypothetical protein